MYVLYIVANKLQTSETWGRKDWILCKFQQFIDVMGIGIVISSVTID